MVKVKQWCTQKSGRSQIYVSSEFKEIVNYIRAKYILEGKPAPSIVVITEVIAKMVDKERLLNEYFLRF